MIDDYTRLTEGQSCPVTSIKTISGERIDLAGLTSEKPILITFFIASCPHCMKAMKFLEGHIAESARDRMTLIAIGRNHSKDEVIDLQRNKGWSLPLAADPDKAIYNLFAEKKVPRTYLFNTAGELVHQVRGFNEEQYSVLKEIVQDLLAPSSSAKPIN